MKGQPKLDPAVAEADLDLAGAVRVGHGLAAGPDLAPAGYEHLVLLGFQLSPAIRATLPQTIGGR